MTFENLDDPEYLAMRAAKVDMLCQDPKYARCRRCVDEAQAIARALGLDTDHAVVHCETRCPLNPDHAAARVWETKRSNAAASQRRYRLLKKGLSMAR